VLAKVHFNRKAHKGITQSTQSQNIIFQFFATFAVIDFGFFNIAKVGKPLGILK